MNREVFPDFCSECKEEIVGTVCMVDDKPYCVNCYNKLFTDPEEEELLEIRAILQELHKDLTIKDEDSVVKVLDLTKNCLIHCKRCDEIQPHIVKQYSEKHTWFYCDECGFPNDFEIIGNI